MERPPQGNAGASSSISISRSDRVRAAHRRGASHSADSLTALLAAVGVLLLIACANLANLLLARGAARKAEMRCGCRSARAAAGSSANSSPRVWRWRHWAASAAIAVAYVLHGALVRMLAESDPSFRLSFALDPLVSAFLVAATLVAALLFGLLPAWQVTRTDVGATLKEQWRGAIGSRAQLRSGRLLVSLQLALSLPLLVGAGLLARTAYNLQRVDLGFAAERLLLVRVDLRDGVPDPARRNVLSARSSDRFGEFLASRRRPFRNSASSPAASRIETSRWKATSRLGKTTAPRPSTQSVPAIFRRWGRASRSDATSGKATASTRLGSRSSTRRLPSDSLTRRNPLGLSITVIESDDARTTYRVVGVARNTRTYSLRDDDRAAVLRPGRPDTVRVGQSDLRDQGADRARRRLSRPSGMRSSGQAAVCQ